MMQRVVLAFIATVMLSSVSENKTKIIVVGLGYNDTEQSKRMRAFFDTANRYSMDQLSAAMKIRKKSETKQY